MAAKLIEGNWNENCETVRCLKWIIKMYGGTNLQ